MTRWTVSPFDVYPFSTTLNQIVFPYGIMSQPFFDVTFPRAINFGAAGAILGHELGHNFDNECLKYDWNGVLREWLTNSSIQRFNVRSECLIKQYSNYVIDGHTIDGKLTLSIKSI